MSSDLRYHIASLAALFLALGIGILIGTAFVSSPVVERQTRFIRNLDDKVNDLRRETQETVKNEEALSALLPRLVTGKLAGRRVLVVQTGNYAAAAEQTEQVLRQSGAVVNRITLPDDAWRRRGATSAALSEEARRLAALLVGPTAPADLEAFRRDGLLLGTVEEAAPRLVVLVGGAQAPAKTAVAAPGADDASILLRARDLPLIRAWLSSGVAVVGVEPLEADVSFIPAYQAEGLATVDNIDRAAGQIALPYALRGEKAAYGMKATAERILPVSLGRPVDAPTPVPTPVADAP